MDILTFSLLAVMQFLAQRASLGPNTETYVGPVIDFD